MKRAAFAAGVLCAVLSLAANAVTLHDDLGRKVVVAEPARRIVTLAPFLTELAFAAGAGDRVVGVSAYSDYPPAARALPVVSSAVGVSLEQLAALKPGFVIAWRDSFRMEDVARIEQFGAAVFIVHGRRLEDVPKVLRVFGAATGVDVSVPSSRFEAEIAALRARYSRRAPVDVFLEIWNKPLTTIAGDHFMNDALAICGARNIFKEHPGVAPQVSWEELYVRDPPIIVGTGSAANAAEFRANWSHHATLSAVKANRLAWIEADTLQRPTTRTSQGVAQLCAALDRLR
jgi:iron complex transport system substrate-binding protein